MQVVECGQLPLHHRLEFAIVVDRDSRVLDDHDAGLMHALRHRLNAQSCQLEQQVIPHIAAFSTYYPNMTYTLVCSQRRRKHETQGEQKLPCIHL